MRLNLFKIPKVAQWVETVIKTSLFDFTTPSPDAVPDPLHHPAGMVRPPICGKSHGRGGAHGGQGESHRP